MPFSYSQLSISTSVHICQHESHYTDATWTCISTHSYHCHSRSRFSSAAPKIQVTTRSSPCLPPQPFNWNHSNFLLFFSPGPFTFWFSSVPQKSRYKTASEQYSSTNDKWTELIYLNWTQFSYWPVAGSWPFHAISLIANSRRLKLRQVFSVSDSAIPRSTFSNSLGTDAKNLSKLFETAKMFCNKVTEQTIIYYWLCFNV